MQNRLLGIHMIVQNEELHLPRCLDSLKKIGAECFITDTGSTDRTPEIARSYGAKVLHTRWIDDFAHARNISLPLANTEWILCMDADEYVIEGLEELIIFLRDVHKSISRLRITIENRFGEREEDKIISHPVRLFRANQGYRYVGRIHEQLVRQDTSRIVQRENTDVDAELLAPLRIGHDGYLASAIIQGHKPRRNLKLIEMELANDPNQPFQLYNLGVTYCQLGQFELAMEAFHESLSQADLVAPYRPTLVRDYAKLLMALERYEEAHALLSVERQRYSSYADLHLLYGEVLERQGLEERAYQSYARATECQNGHDADGQRDGSASEASYVTEVGSDTYRAHTAMARLAQRRGFLQESVELYGLALDSSYTYGAAWTGLADVLQQSGETDESITEQLLSRWEGIDESVEAGGLIRGETILPNSRITEDHLAHVVRVLAGCGAYEMALNLLDRDASHALIHVTDRIHWLLCAGKMVEAQNLAEEYWSMERTDEDDLNVELRMDWALASWGNGLRLSDAFLATVDKKEREVWQVLDRELHQLPRAPGLIDPKAEEKEKKLRQWSADAQRVMEQAVGGTIKHAVQTGQLTLAEQLHEVRAIWMHHQGTTITFRRQYAGLLYRHGYTLVAANILIECMTERDLDAEGLFWLGETLYAKGYYDQALSLFEQALDREPDSKEARAGAAVCYLRLALEAIRQEFARSPSSEVLALQHTALEQRLRTAEGIPWRTVFHARERRNHLASTANLPVHDREG